jgi:hypothetical protein
MAKLKYVTILYRYDKTYMGFEIIDFILGIIGKPNKQFLHNIGIIHNNL